MEHPLTPAEKLHYTNLWCRQKGIHAKDLENHPQADDVVLLINFRDEFWQWMSASDRGVWSAYWDWCYFKAHNLKKKHLAKLQKVIESAQYRQQKQKENINKIKAIRAKAELKMAC